MVIRLVRKAVATLAAVSLLVADVAWAGGPVADPAAPIGFRPTVQAAPNGVPTVNIVNPSAGGVSHNKYTGFDVDPQGAVLNNSMISGTSVLAGALAANPNLTAPAQVILNEVTGTGASQLKGPTEVFGPAANVIVANPNGISVDGGSFINTPRVTLTTGTPTYSGLGAYEGLGFSVQAGQLSVGGTGLDGSGIDQLDLVGRRVVVDGAVSGATALNVTGGGADYAYATGTATSAAAPAQAGVYAIDASALGAMNAGQVKLIGTEAGIGVRALGGVAASAGDVTITSTGQIVVNGASASRDVALSGTDISAGGTIAAARNLSLAASQAATTSGTHGAQNVTVTAGTTAALGATTTATSLTATATGALSHTGSTTLSGGNVTLAGAGVTTAGTLTTDRDVSITSTAGATLGGTTSARALTATATSALSHTGSTTLSGGNATLSGAGVTTASTLTTDRDVSITSTAGAALGATTSARALTATAAGTLSHTGATTLSGGNATLAGAGVTTSGTLTTDRDVSVTSTAGASLGATTSARDLTASATGALATSGTTTLTGAASLSGGTVTTAGILSADGAVGVTASSDATLGGSVTARGNLTATAGNALAVNGTVAADGSATANAASVSVASAGALSAGGAVSVTATGAMTNAGVLDAGAGLSLNAGSLDNTGRASAATALNVTTTGAMTNTGGQMAGDSVGISAGGALTNTTGSITGTNAVAVTAGSVGNRQGFLRSTTGAVAVTSTGALDNTQGAIGGTDIGLTAGSLDNSAGEAIATGNLGVTTTAGALVNKGGTLFANGTTTLTSAAGVDNSAQGSVGAIGALAVGAQGTIDNTGGTMVSNDRVAVTTPGQIIQGGNLTAAGDVSATAGTFTNRGYTASASALSVSAGTIVNESGQMVANTGVGLTATGLVDNRALIASGVDVGVVAGSLSNSASGRMEANRHLAMATTGAMSNAGIVAANGTLALSAGTTLTNTKGTMLSGGTMALDSGTAFTNEAGTIQSGGDMAVRAGTRIDNRRGAVGGGSQQYETTGAATLSSGGALLLQAPVVRNEASLLSSAGNMTVTATTFENLVHSLLWRTTYSWQSCSRKWWGGKSCNTYYGYSDSYSQTPSLVYAGGTLALNAPTITNTGTIQANRVNAVTNAMTNGIVDWTIKTMPAAVPSARIDLTQYAALPDATPGLFDISRDPASHYVITTTVNVANLIDPDALNARLGQAAAPNPRFFADPFAEAALLRQAALAQTGQRFFVPQATTDEQQRQALYDNAVAFAAGRTDVKLGVSFTDAQIAALSQPILWYVNDGTGVLAPVVYLPQISQQNLVHQEGGRIIADQADIQVAGQFKNTGFVNVAGALAIDAGSIVNEQRIAVDTQFRAAKSKGKSSFTAVDVNVLQQGGEITGGSVSLRSDSDVTSVGGKIAATGALAIDAANNVSITAAQVSNHERISAGKATWESSSTVNYAALLLAGLDLSILAGGDVAVGGSKLQAAGDVTITAGRDLTIAAMVDEQYASYRNKKNESTLDTSRNKGSSILSTGGSVDAWAGDNLAVQASRVAAAGDITLEANQGTVALLSGTDSTFIHEKSEKKSLVWQSTRDKGESGTKVVMTELQAGGALNVAAGAGVVADYRATGDLATSLAALSQDPRTAWVGQIAQRPDVNWRGVSESYQSWDHKTQGLTPAASIVIAIAVAVATQGAGVGALGAMGVEGLSATTAAMANAGFSALVSQASVSLINNQGDLGKVLKELGSIQTVKNLAVAVATAGLTQGVAEAAGVSDSPKLAFAERAAYQGIKAGVGVAVNSTIGGANLNDALVSGGLSMATAMASQTLFQGIGDIASDLKIDDGDIRKVIAHALAGCAAGQITRNCVGGAIGAGLQELGVDKLLANTNATDERKAQLAGLIAATATLLVGGDAGAVSAANSIAVDARTYNRQLHVKELSAIRDKAKALADANGDGVLSASEAAQASDWEARLSREALRTVDAYWNAQLDGDIEAARVLKELAVSTPGFDVTVGGKAVAFLQRDSFYDNRALYANYIRENADLYDKALAEWTPASRSALQGKVSPSSLAIIDSIGSSSWKDLSPKDVGASDGENIARTGATMVDALADIRAAERELRDAYGKLQTELNGGGLTGEQRQGKEAELKQLRSEITVAAQASNMARMGFDQLLVSGGVRGVEAFVKESVGQLAVLAWDVASAPASAQSRQDLLDRAAALGTLLGNPGLVVDHFRDAYAQADVLQQQGHLNDAEQIRAQTTLDLLSMVAGGAGIAKAAVTTLPKVAELAKIVGVGEKGVGGTSHGIGSAVADAEAGGPNVGPWQEIKNNQVVTKWPPNDGFKGTPEPTTLRPGTIIDRYGDNLSADFFAPVGTPFEARALPPGSESRAYVKLEVLKPINAQAGEIAPWFGQPGGGAQFKTEFRLQTLLDEGYVRIVR